MTSTGPIRSDSASGIIAEYSGTNVCSCPSPFGYCFGNADFKTRPWLHTTVLRKNLILATGSFEAPHCFRF